MWSHTQPLKTTQNHKFEGAFAKVPLSSTQDKYKFSKTRKLIFHVADPTYSTTGTWQWQPPVQLMQLLGPLVTTRQAGGYLDLEGENRICMVLEWTLGLKRLAATPGSILVSLLQCQSTSQGNMGDSEPPDILCESCACIIHTNLQSCMSIFSETLHDHHRASEIPSYQLLGA